MAKKNKIGCSSGRVSLVDPNDFDGFDSSDNVPVALEDLNISVALTSFKKGRTILTKGPKIDDIDATVQTSKNIKVNFIQGSDLNGKKYLTTKYTDLITNINDGDNEETLGITSIDIEFNSSYAPLITINFVDVRGSSIFQNEYKIKNSESKYTTFFQLPYPLFELEIKGFYGLPVKYCLHMYKFNSKFNSKTGNFEITANFIGYTYAMLSDMLLGYLKAVGETKLGKARYEIYNQGKSTPVLTLNELASAIQGINPGLTSVNTTEGGDYQNATESIGLLDDISGQISTLGSYIDKEKNNDNPYDFIVLVKDDINKDYPKSKIKEYQTNVFVENEEESLVLKYNEKTPNDRIVTANWVFKYDTNGNGNRLYKNLTLKKLNNATDIELKIYFGNYDNVSETLNDLKDCLKKYHTSLNENTAIDVIDMRLLKQILKFKKDNSNKRQKDAKSELAEVYKDEVRNRLGFEPTSRPLIECFTAAIEVLSECIYLVADATANHAERTTELTKAFKIEGTGSRNSDIKDRHLKSNDYLPWPAYQEYDTDKKAYVEKYLGLSTAIENPLNIDEIEFIEDLHKGFLKSQQIQEDLDANLNSGNVQSWFAVNPMDLKEYSTEKPYKRFKPETADDVLTFFLIRAMTFLGYTNNYSVLDFENDIKAMAKKEAEAILKDIEDTTDKKIRRQLTQKTTKDILATIGNVNNNERVVLKNVGGSYKYEYLFNQGNISILPMNQGFLKEYWAGNVFDDKIRETLQAKANNGFIFLTNYSSNSSFNIKTKNNFKVFDGGVYLKIIDPNELTPGELPSEIIGENIIDYTGLKKENILNSSDAAAAGFSSLSSQFGLQEYVNMKWGTNEIPVENTFKYVFYKNTPIASSRNKTVYRGLAYTKTKTYNISNSKDGTTKSDLSYVKRLNEKISSAGGDLVSKLGKNTNSENTKYPLHTEVGNNIYLLSAGDSNDITYPFIETGSLDTDIYHSLFGSRFYYELDKSIIQKESPADSGKYVTVVNCRRQARAMAFLHTLPFNVQSDSLSLSTNEDPFGAPEIINTFRYKGGIIHAPRLWCAYVGSVLWRNSKSLPEIDSTTGRIIGGGSGDKDPIYWGGEYDDVERDEYFSFFLGSKFYDDIKETDIINRLPLQVKREFTKSFFDFVNGNGPTDWPSLSRELEIFDTTNKTSTDFVNLLSDLYDNKPTFNAIFNKSGVKEDIIKKNYYIFSLSDTSDKNSIYLVLNDNCDATDLLIKALKEEVIILNNNYKIWSGGGEGSSERVDIQVKESFLKTYVDAAVEVFKANEESLNENSEEKRLNNAIFGTSNKEEIKLGLYRTCKNIYDKWLSGANNVDDLLFQCGSRSIVDGYLAKKYTNNRPRLIDSFRFVSRAFSDIGDLLYIDPSPINDWLSNNQNMSSYEAITSLLASNNFEFIALPNFINFNDKENLESIFKPYNYYSDRIKNGTCGPSFVCVYAGQSSQHLDYYDNEYENDGFDLRCDDKGNLDSSIPEDFTSETNKEYEESVGGFVVRYSQQNQNIFKDITLDQSEFTETDESLTIQDEIAKKGAGENNKSYLGQNIYNVYAVRSYSAEVEMMGNAMIQPMMYFQLDNIPMFHGAYMIINVNHSIVPNSMKTKFKGVRVKYTKTPLVTAKEVYENLIENSDFANSSSGGGGGRRGDGTYLPIVAALIENGVQNGYIDFGKTYGSVTTKKLTGGSKKYFNIKNSTNTYLIAEAADAFNKMFDDFGDWMDKNGYKKNSDGKFGYISSTYRSYQHQANIKSGKSGGIAASAGKSYHGWGLAVDWYWVNKQGQPATVFKDSGSYESEFDFNNNPALKWLYENSHKYGIINPDWARRTKGYKEVWHWEYHGTSAICLINQNPSVVGGYTISIPSNETYLPIVKNPKKSDGSENVFSKTSCKGIFIKGDGTDEDSIDATQTTDAETLNFFKKLLKKLNAPETEGNLIWLKAWRQAEGGKATWNPFNSTQKMNGATVYNSLGVKNYKTESDGLTATYDTINNGLYPNIVKGLQDGIANKAAALNLAIELQKTGKDLCIWVQGQEGCRINGGKPKTTYLAQILSASKVSGNNIYKPKSVSSNESESSSKNTNKSDKKGIIVYGGIGKYGAQWMKEQWVAAGLSTDIANHKIVFEEYNGKSVQTIKNENKDYKFIGLFGFSAGGKKVWPYTISNEFSIVGLIDPSTSDDDLTNYASKQWEGNTQIMLNPTNWSGQYKPIGDRLLKIKKGKTDSKSEYYKNRSYILPVNDKHIEIPLKFFTKFKDKIEDL